MSIPEDQVEIPAPEQGKAEALPAAEDWRDKYLRALAELDNYRKRMERERDQNRAYATGTLVRDLLPLLDALHSVLSSPGDAASLRAGVELALAEAMRILSDSGLEVIAAIDVPFDPRFHEACGVLDDPTRSPGTVVAEVRRGYKLKDRVLRPSQVQISVSTPAPSPKEGS